MIPTRTSNTMVDAIALSSPSGRMSKRARKAAEQRLARALFGDDCTSLKGEGPKTSRSEVLRRSAKDLRDLADRGMSTRKFNRAAERMEKKADELES